MARHKDKHRKCYAVDQEDALAISARESTWHKLLPGTHDEIVLAASCAVSLVLDFILMGKHDWHGLHLAALVASKNLFSQRCCSVELGE